MFPAQLLGKLLNLNILLLALSALYAYMLESHLKACMCFTVFGFKEKCFERKAHNGNPSIVSRVSSIFHYFFSPALLSLTTNNTLLLYNGH